MTNTARALCQALLDVRDGRTLKGRKDAFQICDNLLKRSDVLEKLDANGDVNSENQGTTWEEVLDLGGVILNQTLRKNRGKETAGIREERDAAVNLLDTVVALSVKKGGRIKAERVLQLIIPILRDKENQALVGRQLLRILKQLLKAPHHQADLPSQYYNGLIKMHIKFITETTIFNPVEVSEMLHAVTKAAVQFSEVDVALCAQFLESVINKLKCDRSTASPVLMLHLLGIWRLFYEYYNEEYHATFVALANALLEPVARSCYDSKDSQLEVMLFLIVGQAALISERSTKVSLLDWTFEAADKALRTGRIRSNPQLRTLLAAALATCASTLMENKDRFTLDKHRAVDGAPTRDGSHSSKRLKESSFELGVIPAFDNYKKTTNELSAAGFWLAVVQHYIEKCPSTVTPATCASLIKEVCSEVLVRSLDTRTHLIAVLRSLLVFHKANRGHPSQQVLDVLVRTLDANHCVDQVYSIIDIVFESDVDTASLRKALFRGHHLKSEEGMVILKRLCIQNQITQERFHPLEWIFNLQTSQLATKANIVLALCLKRTSCAFGPGKLSVECLPDVVDEVCHRLHSAMAAGSKHFLYVAVLFVLKICRVRNPSAMLEPLMASVHEALQSQMKSPIVKHDELLAAIEVFEGCREHFVNRVIRFSFMPLVQAVRKELEENFLANKRTDLEMAMDVDSRAVDEANSDGIDKELARVSAMCRFLSLHTLVQCKSAEELRVKQARAELGELLQIIGGFTEERLKSPVIVRIFALLVRPLVDELCLWTADDDPLLEQIGYALKMQLELTFNKPDLVELIMPAIQSYIFCAAKVYGGREVPTTTLARRLLRRLIVSFQQFQSNNAAFGGAVLRVLTAAVDLDPCKNWLYYDPSGQDRRTGVLELLVENVNCPVFRIRKELAALLPALFARKELTFGQRKHLLDLMFDSYGIFAQKLAKISLEQNRQSVSRAPNSQSNINEKLASSVALFGQSLRELTLMTPSLTAHSLAHCCRLWRARILSNENLLELLQAMGDVDQLLEGHLAQLLVVWHKRFMLTLEMDETDESFPFFIANDVRHFMRKFGHVVSPTLLVMGNLEARDAIRGVFGGSIVTYFTPVAASCLLSKHNYAYFVELTRSLKVDKKMLEFLVPVYTRIIMSLRVTEDLNDCEVTFTTEEVSAALSRAAAFLQAAQGPQDEQLADPWTPFTLKAVPHARLPQLIAKVLSSPQLVNNAVRCAGCLAFLVTHIVVPLATSTKGLNKALPTAVSMLFARCCHLLLEFPDDAAVRQDCLPALASLLDLGTDTTLLAAPALAVAERLCDEQVTQHLFARVGALTDAVVARPHGLVGALQAEDIRLLIRSIYFYMTNDRSPHPVRLLARVLRHHDVRRVLMLVPENDGIKLQAENISIDEYPGYVLLAVILDRLKTSSGMETAAIFSCLDTLGAVTLQSWTLRPFLHEFGRQPLPYLQLKETGGVAGSGIVVSFAQQRIVERLLAALQSGSQAHLDVVTDCLAELFTDDIGVEISSSLEAEHSYFSAHVFAFTSQKGKRLLPITMDEVDTERPDLTAFVARIGAEGENGGHWLREATEMLIAGSVDSFLRTILPLCQCDERFCSDIFPLVMYCVYTQVSGRLHLNDLVSQAFARVVTSKPNVVATPSAKVIYTKLVQFVCILHLHGTNVDHIDLMAVARTAFLCDLHECLPLLLTLWWEKLNVHEGKRAPVAFHEYDGKVNLSDVQDILVSSSKALGAFDSLLGCFSRRACDDVVRKALGEPLDHFEVLLQQGEFRGLRDIVKIQQNCVSDARTLEKYAIDCAFRLGQWDQVPEDAPGSTLSFRKSTMLGLTGISSADTQLLEQAVKACTDALVSRASKANLNMAHEATRFLVCVDQVQLLQGYLESRAHTGSVSTAGAWDGFVSASERRFKHRIPFVLSEEYLWLKAAIFNTLPHIDVGEHLLEYGILAVQSSKLNLARAALLQLEGMGDPGKLRFAYLQAATQAHMDVNDVMTEQLSARLTADLAESSSDISLSELRARALLLRGRVLAETQRATPRDIAEFYFKPAVKILQTSGGRLLKERVRAYRELATFADNCARSLVEYFHSSAFTDDNKYLSREGNICGVASQLEEADVRNHKLMLRDIDQLKVQIQDKKDSLADLAVSALSNYLQVLRLEQDQNTKYRVFSLWYSHKDDHDVSRCLQRPMEELTSEQGSISIHGFADMFYQLAACMAIPSSRREDEPFQRQLEHLVLRLSRKHPFHCVPTLLLLANPRLGRQAGHGVDLKTKFEELEERGRAAKKLLDQLMNDSKMNSYISNLEVLAAAYAELSADTSVPQGRGAIKKQCPIVAKNRYFQELPILTSDIPICPDGSYDHVERIRDFIQQYEICAGLSRPKKMIVRGNRGTCYIQLLKGKDDLRQDAVMQQLFKEVSRLRSDDGQFRVRVRTYKVVPLSRFVGVIEWVHNTTPLASILIGSKSALHEQYNPAGSLKPALAHKSMQNLAKAPTAEDKKARFLELCDAFPPAFRFFFLERFRDPVAWLERQRAYVNSLAITSMVGYIIGLGDRHTNNILIDCNTSEVVHIDLGIIFEQGKLLYTPELVPFRLTRDMIDGCGIFGVEGQFRVTCERTLDILRKNSQLLIAIVEVILLHDPLTLFSGKAKAAAGRNKDNPLKEGQQNLSNAQFRDRVLQRLLDKLEGIDDVHPLSVQGQVNVTIQQAVDPLRLAQIFHGWKPYL